MSVSPAPSDGEQPQKALEQITFRFCRECSNMLYPKEDRMSNTLMFACRTCQFSEPATSSCVFRNILHNSVGETAGVTQDVGSDPTVGLPEFCTLCGQEVLCFFCGDASCAPIGVKWWGQGESEQQASHLREKGGRMNQISGGCKL
ncbi:MAG: hypothetical protein M1830_006010 [Pleopsidium flavum]|nr:MAG: hypothetical protein M1830_006010 [Pleopsidium flavum]